MGKESRKIDSTYYLRSHLHIPKSKIELYVVCMENEIFK